MTMLQFSGIFINLSARHTTRVPLWYTTQLVTAYSSVSNPKTEPIAEVLENDHTKKSSTNLQQNSAKGRNGLKNDSLLNLKELLKKKELSNVEKLLSSVDLTKLTPSLSLKIISKLSTFVKEGSAKTADFETDPRYKLICRFMLEHSSRNSKKNSIDPLDSETSIQEFRLKHLGFLFDVNEIKKTLENPELSIHEAVKIMNKLAFYRTRLLPVLQNLADRIIASNEEITIKTASDILYDMSILNFYDENLMEKIVSVLNTTIPKNKSKNSSVIGSILTSIGWLRYKNETLLSHLTTWMLKNHTFARPQDISSFIVTLAILDYVPKNNPDELQNFVNNLNEATLSDAYEWLDVVWSLLVLNLAEETQVMSILNSEFMNRLLALSDVSELKKRKLLNISAAANLIFKQNTDQFFVEHPSIKNVKLTRNREKDLFVKGIINSLYAFLPSTGCLKTDVNTGMGFSLDAEFHVDKNCNPILLSQIDSKNNEAKKLGIQSLSYYDYCRGEKNLLGQVQFQQKLLALSGYHVINIPYKEFPLNQRIVDRVKYLKKTIENTVKQTSC